MWDPFQERGGDRTASSGVPADAVFSILKQKREDLSLGVSVNVPPSIWWFEEDPDKLMVTFLIKIEEVKADPTPRALGGSWGASPPIER